MQDGLGGEGPACRETGKTVSVIQRRCLNQRGPSEVSRKNPFHRCDVHFIGYHRHYEAMNGYSFSLHTILGGIFSNK